MRESVFTAVCPHCRTKNKVTAFAADGAKDDFFSEETDFHCAYCGLKIGNVLSVASPKTEIEKKED